MLKKYTAGALVVIMLLVALPLPTKAAALPNLNSKAYTTSINPYYAAGYKNTCTWYAWGRVSEALGVRLPAWSNAITWYNYAKTAGFEVGTKPRANAIAVWGGSGGYGHVAYVEEATSSYLHVTEGGWGGSGGGYAGNPTCHEEKVPISRFVKGVERHPGSRWQDVFIGFIYLTPQDTQAPVIGNIQITDVSTLGYTVSCTVTDDTAVARVQFATWVAKKGKASLAKDWRTNPLYAGTQEGATYTFRVEDKAFGFAKGEYNTQLTAFDTQGNKKSSYTLRPMVKNVATEVARTQLEGNTYILYNDNLTYAQAQKRSAALGGHLAAVTTLQEQRVVRQLVKGQARAGYLLGGSKQGAGGGWAWETGESFKYTLWASGQPAQNPQQAVMAMQTNGRWTAAYEKQAGLGYIVEIPRVKIGWEKEENQWFYYKNNQKAVGWQTIEGKSYYFNTLSNKTLRGRMVTGWQEIKGKSYYFRPSGGVATRGEMLTGWQRIAKKDFYFAPTGARGKKGTLATGWRSIGGKTYYFEKQGGKAQKGRLYVGQKTVEGKRFYFSGSKTAGVRGSALTGLLTIKNRPYYFAPSGKAGQRGRMLTGWRQIKGETYYLRDATTKGIQGSALFGLHTINGKTYYFNTSKQQRGRMLTGWQKVKGKTYFLRKTGKAGVKGAALTGRQIIAGKTYYFDAQGACKNPPKPAPPAPPASSSLPVA